MANTGLTTQTHMGVGVSGGAQMGNMNFNSPGLQPINPNYTHGGNLQRQPGMMPS